MHDTLRRRILRRLETLPEAQLYQVLDYIEFLESRHGEPASQDASGLQKLAERLEDGLRRRTFSPTTMREAFQLISVADRLLTSVSEAGREILSEVQEDAVIDRGRERGSGERSDPECRSVPDASPPTPHGDAVPGASTSKTDSPRS